MLKTNKDSGQAGMTTSMLCIEMPEEAFFIIIEKNRKAFLSE